MGKKRIISIIAIFAAVAAIYIWSQYHAIKGYSIEELKGYRDRLAGNVSELRYELEQKKDELAALDRKLVELEEQYNRLLEEKKRIDERLEELQGDAMQGNGNH